MKRLFVFAVIVLALAGCQQKQEPAPQYNFPVGQAPAAPIQAQDEVKLLREALRKDPKNLNGWIKLGNTLMDTSRPAEAVEAYAKALELDPKNVDVRVDMATCYKYSGRPDMAVKEYRKALEDNPNHVNAHLNLGVTLAQDLKDNAKAIKEFEKVLQLAPNHPNAAGLRQEIERMKSMK
ncbi:MAG: hypothetical protein OHK006_24400 [Thermodesulfovibrionales bacterium]